MDNVDKFLDLFSDFEMIVISKEDRRNRVETKVEPEHKTKADLKKALKRLEREYKHALKSYKINKISKGELYEFEWRIFELQEEIKKMEQRGE